MAEQKQTKKTFDQISLQKLTRLEQSCALASKNQSMVVEDGDSLWSSQAHQL